MQQRTLVAPITFEGKGLHTGARTRIEICPAAEGEGISFRRMDISPEAVVPALAEYVSSTARSTCLGRSGFSVRTVEHLLSALTGLGIDNARVDVYGEEIPILDGSAREYVRAISADGLAELSSERAWLELPGAVEVHDSQTGAFVRVEPSEETSFEITADYSSRVLGVQKALWNASVDYASEIAPCRTFVFFHELEYLHDKGLISGGDVENAIVVVENPVNRKQLDSMAAMFGQPSLDVTPEGYLSNLSLRFPNECGRHKLLDIIGDMRLCGGFLKAKVTAYKPGHSINTRAARAVADLINKHQGR